MAYKYTQVSFIYYINSIRKKSRPSSLLRRHRYRIYILDLLLLISFTLCDYVLLDMKWI